MDCIFDCPSLEQDDDDNYCEKYSRYLGDPPQMVSECEAEVIENEKINHRDEAREDKRL